MAALAVLPMVRVDHLKPALKTSGLTQVDVARQLGVPATDVCKALAFAAPGGLLSRIAEAVFDAAGGASVSGQND